MPSLLSSFDEDDRAERGRREDDARYEQHLPARDDRDDDYREEMAEKRSRRSWTRCRDRMCGALDCPTCYPLSFDSHTEPCDN